MRYVVALAAVVLLASCRGESQPRDYQNAPPSMTNPPSTKSETPSAHGLGNPTPEPSTGVEGTAGPGNPVTPPVTATTGTTTTIPDTPPVPTTTT